MAESKSETRLILVTMVKNESRIIKRLMNSVKGKVDGIIVCDTGSADNTVELARGWLTDNEMPGEVYEFPFVNFGKSRTKSFQCAQEWVNEKSGWPAANTWALLLDGDMMLGDGQTVSKEVLDKLPPNAAGMSLKQANGSLVYNNVRVIRTSEPWICKGATHEAWTCPAGRQVVNVDEPVLVDRNDGGCKADKYPRDVRLLLEDLTEMPNDARTHFYLGQTYLCMREYEKAIPVLQRRIEIGGWDEEVYIAYMYLGECLMGVKREAEAVKTWLDGWQYRQHRTEIPLKLIRHYREKPKSQFIAAMFLEKVFAKQYGEDLRTGAVQGPAVQNRDVLFVNKRDVDYHIWEELGILAFYTGLEKSAWLRLDALDLTTELGWHDFNTLFGQLHWYDWIVPCKKERLKPKIGSLPWVDEDDAHIWQPFNPSIRARSDGSGYDLNLRFANYYTKEARHYGFRGFDGQVLTRNCLTFVPSDAVSKGEDLGGFNKPSSLREITVDKSFKQDEGSNIRGVEDCRLIQGTDKMEYFGTSKSYADNGINKIFHVWEPAGAAETNMPSDAWHLRQLPLPAGVSPGECQKNWLGFLDRNTAELGEDSEELGEDSEELGEDSEEQIAAKDKGEYKYIYSFSPFRVCSVDGKDCVKVDTNKGPLSLKEYRGSAGPVAWSSEEYPDERWLCVMHKVQIGGDGRWYYHRFMTLDKDLRPSRVSCFVRMTKERVEYWSGLCKRIEDLSSSSPSYFITYGCKDSEAYIAEMTAADIEAYMFYSLKSGKILPFAERLCIVSTKNNA